MFGLGFMSLCGGHFEFYGVIYYDRFIGILLLFFWQSFLIRISDFRI